MDVCGVKLRNAKTAKAAKERGANLVRVLRTYSDQSVQTVYDQACWTVTSTSSK